MNKLHTNTLREVVLCKLENSTDRISRGSKWKKLLWHIETSKPET